MLIEVMEIGRVVRSSVHARPDGRGHEERVAPPPGNLGLNCGDACICAVEQTLEGLMRCGDLPRITIFQIKLKVSLRDALVVGAGHGRS